MDFRVVNTFGGLQNLHYNLVARMDLRLKIFQTSLMAVFECKFEGYVMINFTDSNLNNWVQKWVFFKEQAKKIQFLCPKQFQHLAKNADSSKLT